jgi:deoxyribonuclease V
MKAALDVSYDDTAGSAVAAAVVFSDWKDDRAACEHSVTCVDIEIYVPGEFYRRELPCLLQVLAEVTEPLDCILIDGYVGLGDQPGLGMRLWGALGEKVPVVGVAKTPFRGARAVEVFRGISKMPLYVTAVGVDANQAAANIVRMAGNFRIPTLLKRADCLARQAHSDRN